MKQTLWLVPRGVRLKEVLLYCLVPHDYLCDFCFLECIFGLFPVHIYMIDLLNYLYGCFMENILNFLNYVGLNANPRYCNL